MEEEEEEESRLERAALHHLDGRQDDLISLVPCFRIRVRHLPKPTIFISTFLSRQSHLWSKVAAMRDSFLARACKVEVESMLVNQKRVNT